MLAPMALRGRTQRARARAGALRAALGFAALAGCAEGTVFVPLPSAPASAATMVMGVEVAGARRVVVVDLLDGARAEPIRPELAVGANERLSLEAAFFTDTAATLRLGVGPYEGPSAGVPLPAPAAVVTLQAAPDEVLDGSRWAPQMTLGPILAATRRPPPPTPCRGWVLADTVSRLPSPTRWSVPISDRAVLVGTRDEETVIVEPGREPREGPPSPVFTASRLRGGGFLGTAGNRLGRLELADDGGRTTVDFDTQVIVPSDLIFSTATSTEPTRPGALPDEVFTLSRNGTWLRVRGAEVRELHRFVEPAPLLEIGGTAWIRPGEAVAVWSQSNAVLRARGDTVVAEPTPSSQGLIGVSHLPGQGTFAGNTLGEIFWDQGTGEWTRLPDSGTMLWIHALVATDQGFVFGTGFGGVGEYVQGYGFCPFQPNVFMGDVRRIDPLAGGTLALSGYELNVGFLRRP
jgi:hypothetical protein